MSVPFETDLARRDTVLQGLGTVLDGAALAGSLAAVTDTRTVESARITYIRYKPGRRCLVAYRLSLDGQEIDVYCKAVHRNSWPKYRAAQQRRFCDRTWQGLPATLDDVHVTVDVFPNDYRLHVLARLFDADARHDLLRQLFPQRPDLWTGRVRPLVYKPERRFVGQLYLEDGRPNAVLKCYGHEDFSRARQNAKALSSAAVLRLAPAIGRSRRHGILALPWLEGRLLNEALADKACAPAELADVGRALAEFHLQQGRHLRQRRRKDDVASLRKLAWDLALLVPHRNAEIRELAQRITAAIQAIPEQHQPIHGDFYAKQVVLGESGVALIDLDEAALGDPAIDLGNFAAHLELDALRGLLEGPTINEAREAFRKGYEHTTAPPGEDRLQVFTAAALLRLVPHPFRRGEPDWLARTEEILDRVWRHIDAAGPHAVPAPRLGANKETTSSPYRGPADVSTDPQFRFLRQAFDAEEVTATFHRVLPELEHQIGPYTVRQTRVVRYKPGRRCLLEFRLNPRSSAADRQLPAILGKVRAKRFDETGYDVQSRLWQDGFADDADDSVSVPEPLGAIPEWHMWLQRQVAGQTLGAQMTATGQLQRAEHVAALLHKLHQAAVPTKQTHTIEDELQILRQRLQVVAQQNPHWRVRLHRLLNACQQLAADTVGGPTCGIHRDFYPDQILVSGARLYLVDLDLYCQGHPALDAGNFLAHVIELSVRQHGHPDAFLPGQQAFEQRFLALSPVATKEAVNTYTTLSLARHISISTQFSDRRHTTAPLLELCEHRLGLLPPCASPDDSS